MTDPISRVAEVLMERFFLPVEASGRHVHVTKEQAAILFGHGLTEKRPLSQPGQYLSNERLTIRTEKGEFKNVAVLGPERSSAQVEVSLTDAVALGLDPPVRLSGSTEASPGITLIGPKGSLMIPHGVIVAQRHIHMPPEEASRRSVRDRDVVRLKVFGARPVVFEDVVVRVDPSFAAAVHLDFDEANACGFRKGDLGMILYE